MKEVKKTDQKKKSFIASDKKDFIKFLIFSIVIVIMLAVLIWLLPWIISLKDEAGRHALQEYIDSKGAMGVFTLLGLQIMQVLIAFIPGEPIEIVAGLLYGTFFGYLICTVGMLIGTVIIFYGVRFLGSGFIKKIMADEKFSKYKFLSNTKKLEFLTFLLFFIPGTPKDLLTYFMPFTKIKPMVFFVLVTIARIPSIVSSTFAGASIGRGQWTHTIVTFVIIGVVGIIGIIFNEKLLKVFDTARERMKDKNKKQ